MGICDSVNLDDSEYVESLMEWVRNAFDTMAMGSYPYPSNYMTSGGGYLPAFPIREACNRFLATPMSGANLLAGETQPVYIFLFCFVLMVLLVGSFCYDSYMFHSIQSIVHQYFMHNKAAIGIMLSTIFQIKRIHLQNKLISVIEVPSGKLT